MPRTPLDSHRPLAVAVLALVASGLLTSCITRPVKEPVFSERGVDVSLRSESRFFSTVEKGYEHPVTIAPVRVAHILSRIDLRPPEGYLVALEGEPKKRVAAVRTNALFEIGEGISQALAAAGPDQEVVVMVVRETKRFGVFDHDYLTSFLVYARDDRLYLHMGHFEWEIPKRRKDRLPEPRVGSAPQRYKILPSSAMSLVSSHSVAIDWRDAVFARPTRTRVLPSGEIVRKTILLESPPEVDDIEDPVARMPDDLSPEQLRALADVEEDRREGRITEIEYRSRRRRILDPQASASPAPSPEGDGAGGAGS
ncbi:MAG: hypothetical protein AAF430_04710 [Myxococcota bacterium]